MEPQFYFESPGDDWERYARARFEPRTSQDDSGLETIGQMVRVTNEASEEEFVERVSGFLDLKHFLKHVAVENYLADADGLLGLWGMNNFYLYRFAETTRFQFIPWDKDVTFGNPGPVHLVQHGFKRSHKARFVSTRASRILFGFVATNRQGSRGLA